MTSIDVIVFLILWLAFGFRIAFITGLVLGGFVLLIKFKILT